MLEMNANICELVPNSNERSVKKLATIKSTEDVMKRLEWTPELSQEFNTRIEALDDYFLYNLFSYFGVKEKLSIERVCKRWQTIVKQLLDKQLGLGTTWSADEDTNCLSADRDHCVIGGDIRAAIPMSNGWFYDLTDPKAINNLEFISRKCPNIKCLHISHSIINSSAFEGLVKLFPDLECIHLKSNILKAVVDESDAKKANEEWNLIGKALGPVIRHLSVDPHYEFRMNENHMKNLIQHFRVIEEFRVGNHFDREVVGKFLTHLSPKCKLFYSLGREFSLDALNALIKNQSKRLTHLSYFSNSMRTSDAVKRIGENFHNLVKLKINLSFNETILSTCSPITNLKNLKELSIDMNTFSDTHVDDGLIWCIKDGLPSVKVLEISRACLSGRAFNAIHWCLPQLNKLILKTVEIQCNCESTEVRDRSERYSCSVCKQKCWQSVANFTHLKELQVLSYYFRSDKPKPFHKELSDLLPEFKCLRRLTIFRYDISSTHILESLNKLMTDSNDLFVLKLISVPTEGIRRVKTPKVYVIRDSFML